MYKISLIYIAIPLSLDICCFQFSVIINNVPIEYRDLFLVDVISLHDKFQNNNDIPGQIDYLNYYGYFMYKLCICITYIIYYACIPIFKFIS